MAGRAIEIILMRQLASYLAVPILIVDRNLDLLYFNESAEQILGRRFEETGEIHRGEWSRLLRPSDASGLPIPREEQPLALAIDRNQPSHRRLWLTGLDGKARVIEGLAFPLETSEAGLLGAAGIFWEVRERSEAVPKATPVTRGSARARHDLEVVLLRRLADRLTIPTFVVDADGRLLFYNPPAEPLIGRPFAKLGRVPLGEWYEAFQPTDEDGSVLKPEDHPIGVALSRQEPTYRRFVYQGLDGVKRQIEGTAFPILGQCNRHLGAAGFFWEDTR
jgi:PAS domain-containing protein